MIYQIDLFDKVQTTGQVLGKEVQWRVKLFVWEGDLLAVTVAKRESARQITQNTSELEWHFS